jgi:hypothetical protein
MAAQKSFMPLWGNLTDWLLMFNRREVPYPIMGINGHRLLDDVTSILLWIGLFYAVRHWKSRPCFYALSGLFVMSLPVILASDHFGIERIVGAAPFAAALAAFPVAGIIQGVKDKWGKVPVFLGVALASALSFSAYQNFDVYFRQQAGDRESWKNFMPEETWVGEAVLSHPDVAFEMASRFWGHETVKYLCYNEAARVHPLDLESLLKPEEPPHEKLCFVLDQGKKPTMDLIQQVYPGGREEDLKDPWGNALAYLYYWEPASGREIRPIERRGLQGRYFESGDGSGNPLATRWDPILNFTNLGDFPLPGPLFSARWIGVLNAPQTGTYGFFLLTTDHGELRVDGQPVVETIGPGQGEVRLARGSHRIELSDARPQPGEIRADFHLLWKPPGQASFGVVPLTAFGKIPIH